MKIILLIIITVLLKFNYAFPADMICSNGNMQLRIFYTERDFTGWDAVLKGEVLSFSINENSYNNDLMRVAQDKTKVLVRLYNSDGIKKGDNLFIINDRNLIVSRVEVKSIFDSKTFGKLLVGHGMFRLARKGDRVAQRISDENSRYAFIYKSRGDYFNETGKTGEAISNYKKAIELDGGHPESHISLGWIYLKQNLIQFALKEFDAAYRGSGRTYDREDKYLMLLGMVEARYRGMTAYKIPADLRSKFKEEGIKYSKEALEIYPESKDINYYLALLYMIKPDESDLQAKNQLIKVIEIDPENINAYLNLALLYEKYNNHKKSLFYAEKAVKMDPLNTQARNVYKQIRKK
jgi:tetratricopeptide (TPR) repeat protein